MLRRPSACPRRQRHGGYTCTLSQPPDEATYDTSESAKAALQSHARGNGYGISFLSSRDSRALCGCIKDENKADDEALSQDIEAVIKAGSARQATQKALENEDQSLHRKQLQKATRVVGVVIVAAEKCS